MYRWLWKRLIERHVNNMNLQYRARDKLRGKSIQLRFEELESRLTPSGSPTQVAFTTAAQTLTAGQPSAVMTVQLEDQFGNPAEAGSEGETLNLSSTSSAGTFLDTTGTPLTTPSITIASGASTGSFEYEDTLVGTPTLTVAATGLTSATAA